MLQANLWERPLLDLAHAALESDTNPHTQTIDDSLALADAYDRCESITRANSKTFHMAAGLLPDPKRRATHALYAFCRVSDDMVDRPTASAAADLQAWRRQVLFGSPASAGHREVALAWTDARRAYHIPRGYVDQLIDGISLDLARVRYETFSDLSRYCYGVACTVGLMSMHITGYSNRQAIPYAIRLGVALQLTNILRDVGEDWQNGRLYLPQEEMEAFGINEDYIAEGLIDNRWRAFMRFQIDRARRLYDEALPGVAYLHPDGRFAIAAAGELYRAILNRIETNDYNVFTHRASLGAWGKLRRLPGIWLRSNFAQPAAA